MKITRLYTGQDGESHFEEVEYELHDSPVGRVSERIEATGVIFRETPADYNLDFHPAPRRQFIINLDASVEIEVGDGTRKVIGPGRSCWPRTPRGKDTSAGRWTARCGTTSL